MEEEWLVEISKGNMETLELLYSKLRIPVYAFILSIVSNKAIAEDLTQDTFVQIYTKARLYQKGTNPRSWVFAVARNLSYDTLRRVNRTTPASSDQLENRIATPSQEAAIVDAVYVMEKLRNLADQDRQIIMLKLFNGFTHSEISEILHIPEGTVKWKYRRALHHLEQLFGGDRRNGVSQ